MNKKRVLLVSEAHYLGSGFGTYAKELLTRLHNTDKYELAEFASYGNMGERRSIPWLFYANLPQPNNKAEADTYNSNPSHSFGAWRFDKVCLDFKPDIVLCYRDPWMDNWIQHSPMRPYFHWVWMPTVDSAPQRQEWINTFASCDAVLAYSEFGGEVLQQQGKTNINFQGCASPGIDPTAYKPLVKAEHRRNMNLSPDSFIIGTVMRNQKRKLFFELMKVFRLFLDQAPPEIAAKTFLYLHTSYPEKIGWNIAEGIVENGLGGKVLMTYICRNCRQFFPHIFQDAIRPCKFCGQFSAVCPTVALGVAAEDLPKIYNLFDIYVQYAICEGFGMPQVEAAACGVPIAATDYSAMRDVLRATNGYPIPVRTFFREMETGAERAYPDNQKCADILINFFKKPDEERMAESIEVRRKTIKRYSWDDTAKVWENYIDTYQPRQQQSQWDSSPAIFPVPAAIPPNLSDQDFTSWIFHDVLHQPDAMHRQESADLHQSLKLGARMGQGFLEPVNREQIFQQFKHRAENRNAAEHVRLGGAQLLPEQFLIEAHQNHKQ